ncbi:L-isoleucine 3(1)-dioxygenase [Enterobacillus tribolii]|uniref:Fe2OG dioxygenase domain-containing protein n=1 Tax=Enterobacillus tribolii TaxID=1487935 RepID=A0A370QPV9_9GAMM|nr:L-isoleucine 3(1)-dioxygenase [Enterobacillus tribolii]MBW7981941.1 hypothetical protein [Enterobacillus tribolii]RDK90040.1 hypothetical protein C8D90_106248 [Enterobacillus tribolii]
MSEMITQTPVKLSGKIIEDFGYLESTSDDINFSAIRNLILHGHHHGNVVYIIRNHANPLVCRDIADQFYQKVSQMGGGNRGDDGFVLTNQIGATQFSRNGQQYIEEVNRTNHTVTELFASADGYATESLFMNRRLEREFLDENIHFGPARFKNGYACFATFRRWLDNGAMALMPHEDLAQLSFAAQDDFEIAAAQTVTAYNVCLDAAGEGGELRVWNFIPDGHCRAALGVTQTGYPYPPELLGDMESFSVRLNSGDVYFMNACHLHGVHSVSAGARLTAGRFIGKLDDRKVVYWT